VKFSTTGHDKSVLSTANSQVGHCNYLNIKEKTPVQIVGLALTPIPQRGMIVAGSKRFKGQRA
jgi:hypothetical protein